MRVLHRDAHGYLRFGDGPSLATVLAYALALGLLIWVAVMSWQAAIGVVLAVLVVRLLMRFFNRGGRSGA